MKPKWNVGDKIQIGQLEHTVVEVSIYFNGESYFYESFRLTNGIVYQLVAKDVVMYASQDSLIKLLADINKDGVNIHD